MFKIAVALITACILFIELSHADAMVWKVTNSQGELYLGGTIHALRSSDYPLKPEYDIAFKNSSTLIFEADISAASTTSFQQELITQMSLPPGKTLSSLLKPATYQRLQAYTQSRALPFKPLQTFKPAMLILMYTQMELQKLGINMENGIEHHFSKLAKKHGKTIAELESMKQQIGIIATMGQGYEDEFVNGSLDDFVNLKTEIEQLIQAWKDGDVATIDKKMTKLMKNRFPKMYDDLLVKRNNNWVTQIDQLIKTPKKEFILVGAAHLAGSDSVISLLTKKGYKVEKVTINSTPK